MEPEYEEIYDEVVDWKKFMEHLFKFDPSPIGSYTIEFNSEKEFNQNYGYMLIYGSKILYNKEPCNLNESEISYLLKYFHSFGIDVEWELPVVPGNYKIYFKILKKTS